MNLLSGTLDTCLITCNRARSKGGGVYVGYNPEGSGGANTLVTNCIISRNSSLHGGGVSVWGGGAANYSLQIYDSTIISNLAHGDGAGGGGIHFQASRLTVRNSRIVGNETYSTHGAASAAGIYVKSPINGSIIENTEITDNIVNNEHFTYGGGLCLGSSKNVIRNCLIARNDIYFDGNGWYAWGGGIYIAENLTNSIESCTITDNRAWSKWQDPKLPEPGGSGVFMSGNGYDCMTNCIVYGNTGFYDWLFGSETRSDSIQYTCSPVPLGGVGNIVADPMFVDFENGDYRLRGDSPCLNSGVELDWMADFYDRDGNPRIDLLNRKPDMGCYEKVFAGSAILVR